MMTDDTTSLLRDFSRNHSEEAFRELELHEEAARMPDGD
jgi:hypothetical protein